MSLTHLFLLLFLQFFPIAPFSKLSLSKTLGSSAEGLAAEEEDKRGGGVVELELVLHNDDEDDVSLMLNEGADVEETVGDNDDGCGDDDEDEV